MSFVPQKVKFREGLTPNVFAGVLQRPLGHAIFFQHCSSISMASCCAPSKFLWEALQESPHSVCYSPSQRQMIHHCLIQWRRLAFSSLDEKIKSNFEWEDRVTLIKKMTFLSTGNGSYGANGFPLLNSLLILHILNNAGVGLDPHTSQILIFHETPKSKP